MFGLGTAEIILIVVIGLVLFGNKLPGIARMLGSALTEFRREASNLTGELTDGLTGTPNRDRPNRR